MEDVNKDVNVISDVNNTATFTQEDLNKIVADRLARQKAQFKDYDELKKAAEELSSIKQQQLSKEEQMQAKIKEYEDKLNNIEIERKAEILLNLKKNILKGAGISEALASRVSGETEEDIKADVEAIKTIMAPEKPQDLGGVGNINNKIEHNPFAKETLNLTEQGKLFKENPALAKQLMQAAGLK